MFSGETTANCSNEYGCSGSLTSLMWLKISYASIGSLFFLALVLSSFERSFSARLRNETVDMDAVVLTRGLALSNCCAVVFIACVFGTNAFFPPKKLLLFIGKKWGNVCVLIRQKRYHVGEKYVRENAHMSSSCGRVSASRATNNARHDASRRKSETKASCRDANATRSRREHLLRMMTTTSLGVILTNESARSGSRYAFAVEEDDGAAASGAATSALAETTTTTTTTTDAATFDFSNDLTSYSDASNNFRLTYPKDWTIEKKAGATALFKNPNVKYASIGVTVTPVRIDSLKEFGSLDDIGQKLVQAESQKQTTVPGGTFMERQSECKSVDTKTTFYEYEYRLITTHGNKRIYNYVGVKDKTLFIVNAQAYEIEDGGESEADLKTRALYREVGRSFDVLK